MERLLLTHGRAPGDIVVMTACVRDLMLSYPGRFVVDVSTSCKSLWNGNPFVRKILPAPSLEPGQRLLELSYGKSIRAADHSPRHFLTAFHADLSRLLGIEVPVLYPKPDLYLVDKEKIPPIEGRYWVVMPGGKHDFTTKPWSAKRYQETIDRLEPLGVYFVQVGSSSGGHWNPKLENVLDLVGKTDLRDLVRIIAHSDGVLCGITSGMHIAAAFDKPCVVIAGGREHWWWEAYVNIPVDNFGPKASGKVVTPHRYLHTQGLLSCCRTRGCWKNKVSRDQPDKHNSYCEKPTNDGAGQTIPTCLELITVDAVVEAIMSYYNDNTLEKTAEMKMANPADNLLPPIKTDPLKLSAASSNFSPPDLSRLSATAVKPQLVGELDKKFLPASPAEQQQQLRPPDGWYRGPFEHPAIGGRVTVCVLMYGDFFDMHRRCMNSILSTIPSERRSIRVAANVVCKETLEYLHRLLDEGQIFKLYDNKTNLKKFPAMRQMFHDPACPITDKWVLWFDDDSIADRDPHWFTKLADVLVDAANNKNGIVGAQYSWKLHPQQINWIKSRPWYRHRNMRLANGAEAPNGDSIVFAAGGWFAIQTEVIKAADIPDPALEHGGGSYIICEQAWQAGYGLRSWNNRRQFINTSSVKSRGVIETHVGMPGWQSEKR